MEPTALTVVVADLDTLDAAQRGDEALSRALGRADVAEGWADFPEVLPRLRAMLAEDPDGGRWGTRLFLLGADPPTLVGWGGFKGPPADGTVEIGYAVAPGFRRRGLAAEAVRQMLADAFSEAAVRAVIAHTLPEPGPSTGVLAKTGFTRDEEPATEAGRPVWRWRHTRS